MAEPTKEPVLSAEEEQILLNQSDSDVEYEDAADELPSCDSASQRLQDNSGLGEDGGNQSGGCCSDSSHQEVESNRDNTDTVPNPPNTTETEEENEQFVDAVHSSDTAPKNSSESEDSETEEAEDPVAAAVDDVEDADKPEDEPVIDDEAVVDEEVIKEREAAMTEEERQAKKDEAQSLKAKGNELFREESYEASIEMYTDALMACPLCYAKERSIMYSNRAACKYKLEKYESAITDSSKALELNPAYLKALLRRAELYEKTDKLDEALVDYQKVLEMDPSMHQARAACMRLPDQIKERNEKMKEEMMGKLKELGNMILKPFGMSTNNFQLQQDPNTGSYSVNFKQS